MTATKTRELNRLLGRRWALVKLVAIVAGFAALVAGLGQGTDRLLRMTRDEIRLHSASGEIAIIEIDARSLNALNQWPWPRRHHAALVDRLRESEARIVAFDVNFSSRSNPVDDSALSAALQRSEGLVALPTFLQLAGSGSGEIVENIPPNMFSDHVFLAGVNIVPEADGSVRQIPLGTQTAGIPRPSLANIVAESSGETDRMLDIDYSIDPATIPRMSFVDVISGRVPPEAIRGKRILVGATAIDMGDRYPVPLHGVIPGVVIQALAAETMLGGSLPGTASGLWPLLLAALVTMLAVRPGDRWRRGAIFIGGTLAVLALPLATEHLWGLSFPIVPALILLGTAAAASLALHLAARFHQRTYRDAETGLPNLAAFASALRGRDDGLAVVARIDRYAAIAAGLGAEASAVLVQRIAERLQRGHDRIIYRTDEHSLAWIAREAEHEELEIQFGLIAAQMRTPVECGRFVDATLAFGVAETARSPKQQIANAALAAERAAKAQRVWVRFVEAGTEETDWHLSLLGELDAAMAAGEVWNAYQPKLDIGSGKVCGVEALVRWDHRERGRVGPDEFIPVVEASGRAADLTVHVFNAALSDAWRWHQMGHDLQVAVNVSATLLGDAEFLADLRARLQASPVPAERVTIEVTESAAMTDPDNAVAALKEWRSLGLKVSIDDYGTGQSSLGYLQKLPATELKIDKSFIQGIVEDNRNAIMVRSTITLAHQLGMKVVAEGVETQDVLDLLAEMDCDIGQGWLIGRPMPAADLEAFLEGTTAAAA